MRLLRVLRKRSILVTIRRLAISGQWRAEASCVSDGRHYIKYWNNLIFQTVRKSILS